MKKCGAVTLKGRRGKNEQTVLFFAVLFQPVFGILYLIPSLDRFLCEVLPASEFTHETYILVFPLVAFQHAVDVFVVFSFNDDQKSKVLK